MSNVKTNSRVCLKDPAVVFAVLAVETQKWGVKAGTNQAGEWLSYLTLNDWGFLILWHSAVNLFKGRNMSQSKGRKEITEQSEGFPSPWAMLTFQTQWTHVALDVIPSFEISKEHWPGVLQTLERWKNRRGRERYTRPALRTRKALQVVRIDSHGLQPQVT